ncbi:MAG: peroxiredoxin family protein [bacterium]
MRSSIRLAVATFVVAVSSAGAQAPAAMAAPAGPPAPATGEMAPDFSAPWADAAGTKATPVSLKSLRGQVVVLAFYPLDRSGGCTIELSKFRDEYTTLFGDGVVVLPVSVDSLESHTGWAKDAKFPFGMISDTKGELATKYGSTRPGAKYFNRTIFVIGKDGKVAYETLKFNVQSQDAWDTLAQEIKKAKTS